MRALEFITSHVIYNPAYTYKFQLKTTQEEESDHDINQDVNRKIRSVLSEHIAKKPSQLEKISRYYFDGEVGEI